MAMAIGSLVPAGVCSPVPSTRGDSEFVSRTSGTLRGFPLQRGGGRQTLIQRRSDRMVVQSGRGGGGGGGGGGAGEFVAGFLLGGVVFGALGYLLAPQVNRSLTELGKENGALPSKSKYLEDEGIEKTRKNLSAKIDELNAAIENVSAQLRNEGETTKGIEASV